MAARYANSFRKSGDIQKIKDDLFKRKKQPEKPVAFEENTL
jgi:hypothetical protein